MANALGIDPVYIVGHLTVFWHAVLEQQEDGDLSQWPDLTIESMAGWKGQPGQFASALREWKWIDNHLVHDWLDYTGEYLTRKYHSSNPQKLKEIWKKHGYKYGKGKGKYGKKSVSKKEVISQSKVRLPDLTSPNLTSPNLKKEDTLAPWQERMSVFWNMYPRKRGKGHVEKWFKTHRPSQALVDTMLQKIELLARGDDWKKDRGQFIPYPATWLNAKGWEDEPSSPVRERLPL